MNSAHNKIYSIVIERFIRTLNSNIHKYANDFKIKEYVC